MKTFQFLVQVFFVSQKREDGLLFSRLGFYSTFFVCSSNYTVAFESLGMLLSERMRIHSVGRVDSGLFRTRVLIDEIWELTDESPIANGAELGFSFFRMGLIAVCLSLIKVKWFEVFRPYLLVDISAGQR